MKKMIFSLLAIAAMTSCTTTSEDEIDPNAPVEIKMNVGIEAIARSAIEGTSFTEDNNDLFRIIAFNGSEKPSDFSSTPYIKNESVKISSGNLAFNTPQYYPNNGDNLYFYTYTSEGLTDPSDYASNSISPTVSYTITGQEDIMTAIEETGSNKTSNTDLSLTFSHQLMRVKFLAVKGTGFGEDKITEVTVKDCHKQPLLNIATGILDWDKNKSVTGDLQAYTNTPGVSAIASPGSAIGDIMIEPQEKISITVIAGGVTYSVNNIALTKAQKNKMNVVTLTFSPKGVGVDATLEDWDNTGTGTGTVQ